MIVISRFLRLAVIGAFYVISLCGDAYAFLVHRTIHGRVVDADTGKPVEGAIALCVWTTERWGVEVTHPVTKVTESLSDHEGRISIEGNWGLRLQPPDLIVYKRGFRAWNDKEVFPAHQARTDFVWASDFAVRLQRWKQGDSFNDHEEFIAAHTAMARTKAFAEAMDWERLESVKENDEVNERMRSQK